MNTAPFYTFVEINPRVKLNKDYKYPFVEMAAVETSRRYVQSDMLRVFKNGGSKFLSGDTLFARITPCLENGKIAQYNGTREIAGFGSTEFFVFRARPGVSDPGFIYYLAKSDIIREPAVKSMSGASGRQRASLDSIVNLEVPAPPLPTQRKIASILSAYDDLIENNLRRIKILEEMAQNLYREWFVKFHFPGHENVRFVDSPLGRIPEGWEVKRLLSVADVTYGFAFKSKEFNSTGNGLPVVRIRDVLAGTSATFTTQKAGKKYEVENGDILVGMDGDFHIGIWVGGLAYLVQRVARFRPGNEIGRYHLYLALQEPIKHLNATITGTTVAHLGAKHIDGIEIFWPNENLRERLNDILENFFDSIVNLRIKNQVLRQTRDLLLPKLISGEVDVSELDVTIPEEIQ
jgi:type I restriction enzyme, S subunit